MTPKQKFGKLLASERVAAGITQADLAAALGYTTAQFVSNWERGISLPPTPKVPEIAAALGFPELTLRRWIVEVRVAQAYQATGLSMPKRAQG